MSEDEKPSPTSSSPTLARKVLAWAGGIISLAALFVVCLYIYGDPRPTHVDQTIETGKPNSIPVVTPGTAYFRIRADYAPLTEPFALGGPIGDLWISLFSKAVRRAGEASVRLLVSYTPATSVPSEENAYFLFNTYQVKKPAFTVTPFMVRRPEAKAGFRLDVSTIKKLPAGVLPKLLQAAGNYRSSSSEWVSVFPHVTNRATKQLDARNAVLAVRDFSGRVVGAVRISLDTKTSMFFPDFLASGGAERLAKSGTSFDARRNIALGLIGGVVDLNSDLKNEIVTDLKQAIPATDPTDDDANCRRFYKKLAENRGLSKNDAAGLAFLLRYQPGTAIDRSTRICGDVSMTSALDKLGMIDALKRIQPDRTVTAKKKGITTVMPKNDKELKVLKRYVCLGLSGPRIARHCDILNDIAREWRGGAKFLNMIASRRHIAPYVGLEEPTPDMSFAAGRFSDRRQLLIHIALSRVENFACFRLTRENPNYFEALVVIGDNGSGIKRRLDVFEFAFESNGRVGRIRRRAAMQSDIDEAARLPETSRCRREFIKGRGDQMRRLTREYWRLVSTDR